MKVPYGWLRDYVEVPVEPRKLGEALTLVGLALEGLEASRSTQSRRPAAT